MHNPYVEMIRDSENKVCTSYDCMVQKLQTNNHKT